MKKYRHILILMLLFAVSLCSFYAFAQSIPSTNVPSVIIKFESNGGEIQSPVITIFPDTTLTETVPTKDGFLFQGWFASQDLSGDTFDFDTKLVSDMTLYAKWEPLNAPPRFLQYGEYPQLEVTDPDTIIALNNATFIDDEYYLYNSKKYAKVVIQDKGNALNNDYILSKVYYFEVLPIEWEVLATIEGSYVLITKNILDTLAYHSTDIPITYEHSDIRDFLINDFYEKAFNSIQQTEIITSDIQNLDNPTFLTPGGANTQDKVYILSINEAKNGAYFDSDMARLSSGTDYAKAQGLYVNTAVNFENRSRWWLRSPGDGTTEDNFDYNNAASIDSSGYLSEIGADITNDELGIRPVIFVPTSLFA